MNTTTEASLPTEVWLEIFSNIDTFKQLIHCSMVNSRWKQLAETAISRRDITITTKTEAWAFYHYLKGNPSKRYLIKHLTMLPQDQPLDFFIHIVPLVLNQHLETFNGSVDNTFFLKAMLFETYSGDGLANFTNLCTIPSAWTYCNIYDTLLHRLRFTLKEITLHFRGIYYDLNAAWPTLYHLDEITQLEALTFISHIHNVKETEAILKNCGHLQRLTIQLTTDDPFHGEKEINRWIQLNTHQCITLKTLKIKFDMTYKPSIVDYLMYKYPQVESIIVEKNNIKEPWGSCPVKSLGTDSFRDILYQIKRAPHHAVRCNVLESEVDEMMSAFTSQGYMASKSYQDAYTPIVSVSNSSTHQSIHGDTSLFHARPSPLRVLCPAVRS